MYWVLYIHTQIDFLPPATLLSTFPTFAFKLKKRIHNSLIPCEYPRSHMTPLHRVLPHTPPRREQSFPGYHCVLDTSSSSPTYYTRWSVYVTVYTHTCTRNAITHTKPHMRARSQGTKVCIVMRGNTLIAALLWALCLLSDESITVSEL